VCSSDLDYVEYNSQSGSLPSKLVTNLGQ